MMHAVSAGCADAIHQGLIETLFRYNAHSRMAGFLDRLGQLCGRDQVVAGDATLAHSRRDTRFIQSDL
jgi:hypothetical protein